MKSTYTTSAQKTVMLPGDQILTALEKKLSGSRGVTFQSTKADNIKEALLDDGSKLVIASFEKENGASIAMIDHKNVLHTVDRAAVQSQLRATLNEIFCK